MSGCAGSEPFALQVLGDSMNPDFADGVIIIVEPDGTVEDGDFVVAHHDDGVILRQLRIQSGGWSLHALNEHYPKIDIDGLQDIRGRVIQRAGRRRKDRKSYL
jgi:DNA polymerase V